MAKLIALLALSLAALVGASAAGANNNFPIYHCPYTSPATGTSGAGQAIYVNPGGGIQQPLTLHFGWAASSQKQVNNFLAVQYAADGGTITDSSGNVVWSYEATPFTGWGIGGDYPGVWTAPTYTTGLVTPGGQPTSGYVTVHNAPITDLATGTTNLPDGTYTLSLEWDISQRVLDGYSTATPGAVYKTTNCEFTVQNY
jgi:hypothetical protein